MKSDIIRNSINLPTINQTVEKLFGEKIEDVNIIIIGNAFIN